MQKNEFMKKLLCLLGVGLALISCTNDFDSSCYKKDDKDPIKNDTVSPVKPDTIPVVVEPILLKKLTHTYENGNTPTIESLYDGTKIVSDKDASNLTYYTYAGDVITKIEKADLSGNVYITKQYSYANGKLDYVLNNEFGIYSKIKYHYNDDGSIFYEKLTSDSAGNDLAKTPITGRLTFANGNLVKNQFYNGATETVTTYEYDSKNNPRLNIKGFDYLLDMPGVYAVNNVVKSVFKSNVDSLVETKTYSYEYDAKGYPVKSTQTLEKGGNITTETAGFNY